MSHVASLFAVVLLVVSIAFSMASLVTTWWDAAYITARADGSNLFDLRIKMSLWNVEVLGSSSIANQKFAIPGKQTPWDDICNAAKPTNGEKTWCTNITAMHAMLILSSIFALFGACGVSFGYYSGNTLVDTLSGVVGTVGNLFGLVAIILACSLSVEDLYKSALEKEATSAELTFLVRYDKGPARDSSGTPGFSFAIATCAIQLVGGICSCVGTFQEIREVAALARVVQSRHETVHETRAERYAQTREAETAQAAEIYRNLAKRAAGQPYALPLDDTVKSDPKREAEEKPIPRALYKVIHRMPQDPDDEIPQKMLVDAFAEIDGDGSGSIDLEELVEALRLCDLNVSNAAAATIMKDIDKNASGDVDMREFIQFFRNIEDLHRAELKGQARKRFASFLANFCFLADVVIVGVLLMVVISSEDSDSDSYKILKNLLIACSVFLGLLFLAVIVGPILRLLFGPAAQRMQVQYELSKEIRLAKRKREKDMLEEDEPSFPRDMVPTPDEERPAGPPVNAGLFGRSYRPGKVDEAAWAPPFQPLESPPPPEDPAPSLTSQPTQQTQKSVSLHAPASLPPVRKGGHWRYDPQMYAVARDFAEIRKQGNVGFMSWSPMQIKDMQMKEAHQQPSAIADTASTDSAIAQHRMLLR